MEDAADVEMPSPKRLRVGASEQRAIPGLSEPIDDFDDIYDTPSKLEEEGTGSAVVPALNNVESPSTERPAHLPLPTLPNLPGLGIPQNDLQPANAIANEEMKDISHDARQESTSVINAANGEDSKVGIPEEMDNDEKRETIALDMVNGTHEVDEQKDMVTNQVQVGREQENIDKEPLTTLDRTKIVAEKLVSEGWDPAPSEVAPEDAVGFQAEEGGSVKEIIEDLPLEISPQLPKLEASDQDPLAFLEASLPPAPCHEAGPEFGMREDINEAEARPVNEDASSEHLATMNKLSTDAEFELDSSPLESDSDLSDDSSQSSDDADDYEMLDPEEQARRLMAEDGGSDEEGGGGKGKASGPLRTQNEKPDEYVAKPDVVITEEMKIEELGSVEGIVENLALIKANITGEYQVLEQGSVLCLEDRSVVGVVAETLGRVQQPYYSVRFTNAAAISEAGLLKDTKVFYVEQYSTPVFTQPLKAFKGSDASNLHDEEVGDDELEFSDDEAEAEYKRRVKMQREQKRRGRDGQNEGFSRGPRGGRGGLSRGRGRGRTPFSQTGFAAPRELQEHAPNPAEGGLNYDDVGNDMGGDAEDLYTPLARPMNLHEMAQPLAVPTEKVGPQRAGDGGGHDRGGHDRGRGRGRGDRGGSRGFGRGRGQGSSGFDSRGGHRQSNGFQSSPANGQPPWPSQQSNGFVTAAPLQQPGYPAGMPNQQPYPSFPTPYAYPWNPHQQQHSPNAYQTQHQHQQQQHQQQQNSFYAQPSLASSPGSNNSNNTPSIPPGAYINPAFFTQPQQQWPPAGNHQQM